MERDSAVKSDKPSGQKDGHISLNTSDVGRQYVRRDREDIAWSSVSRQEWRHRVKDARQEMIDPPRTKGCVLQEPVAVLQKDGDLLQRTLGLVMKKYVRVCKRKLDNCNADITGKTLEWLEGKTDL
ncbi:hypothetical protein Pcinc_025440 [Petrolisthes cinctipes]|uniref:Uncharacterized protein n=1 Tax=Petrolisthes cinctipes TaxID=88211 RepID=A0AAE1KDS4_PETCI|nr:hypothetical protein Pcinc_025440 [Petrolisthes cinctipes]